MYKIVVLVRSQLLFCITRVINIFRPRREQLQCILNYKLFCAVCFCILCMDAMYIQFLHSVFLAFVLQKKIILEICMFLSYVLDVQVVSLISKAAEAELV